MKKIHLICIASGKCERSLLVERWPETKEAAEALFAELLANDERYSEYKWFVDRPSKECYSLLSTAFYCPYRGWRLELIESKSTVIDMTDGGQAPAYAYFVAYQFSQMQYSITGTAIGVVALSGNCEVHLNNPIKSIDDIHKIEAQVDLCLPTPCTITNYLLLDAPE